MYECNLRANRIGVITIKDYKDFKLTLNEKTKEYEVISNKDGFVWGKGASTKGAVLGACISGQIPLKEIDIHEAYVPLHEVVSVLKSL